MTARVMLAFVWPPVLVTVITYTVVTPKWNGTPEMEPFSMLKVSPNGNAGSIAQTP